MGHATISQARSLAVEHFSKPLSSRDHLFSRRNAACQWFITSLPDRDTIALENFEQQRIVLVAQN
jgi:hypothetical protein